MEKMFMAMMADMCPCFTGKEFSEEDKKAMMEKMKAFCGGKMETMSAFFKKADAPADSPCCGASPSEKDKI